MKLILFIYLKTTSMKKTNWKSVLLYIIRIVELVITGAAGGALAVGSDENHHADYRALLCQ